MLQHRLQRSKPPRAIVREATSLPGRSRRELGESGWTPRQVDSWVERLLAWPQWDMVGEEAGRVRAGQPGQEEECTGGCRLLSRGTLPPRSLPRFPGGKRSPWPGPALEVPCPYGDTSHPHRRLLQGGWTFITHCPSAAPAPRPRESHLDLPKLNNAISLWSCGVD